ncbi:CYTH domain-containing protein [Ktedonosporobacter rubrisoli]|uniref:CYTH domain-containing protein n=1 Tax=Ktedonosporobacter rubrisoli TaxID=2509675 RepID=A0A4P6JSP7_KTERU|nr:CYTH domain-containing protein [Ktedonosporobacter rubrisoli]QBD78252.1 CYTH domain-containing protein [Ktedonosporobacter rubrisoli]
MIEVELKFKLPLEAQAYLRSKLLALPSCQKSEATDIDDIYYDTPDFACLQQAVFIRIRNHAHLEIKYHEQDDPAHAHCTEQVFPLPADPTQLKAMGELCTRFLPTWREAGSVEEILKSNGLRAFIHLKNQRTRYRYKHLVVCTDRVEGLGDFLEVETHCQVESEVEAARASLQDFIAELSLPSLHAVRVGYVELWLRQHLPHVYQLGKYRVEDYLEPGAYSLVQNAELRKGQKTIKQ